ncbi:MAG: P-loop NTPase [Ignavibacteriaceae bacterium]|nr:P-loop NTPase [Ignavibacteriaceae bacterium]
MIVAVASGKGGTGKTTVAVNLVKSAGLPVQLLDCDVEEPNAHLFIGGLPNLLETVCVPVPEIDLLLCDGCGACSQFCAYHAIVGLKATPLVFPELCHGCGGCSRVCPRQAIRETKRRIGLVEAVVSGKVTLIQGRLDVGVPNAPPLIRRVKAYLRKDQLALLDAPPGISCPVVTTLRGVDYVVLVTEPTPFGLHDLQLIVELVRKLGLPFGVVVNRVGIGGERVHAFCRHEGIPILLEIPEDRRIAEACSRGKLVVDAIPEYRGVFSGLLARLEQQAERAAARWTFC